MPAGIILWRVKCKRLNNYCSFLVVSTMDCCMRLEVNRVKTIKVLVWFLVPLLLLPQLDGKLLGDHICQTKITVPQEVLKWELKNRTTRTYKWCMSVPPRCSVYATSLVNETKIALVDVTKSIEACCEGFKEQNNFCVSQCQKCLNGLCLKGSCVCQIGWNGSQCDTPIASSTPYYSSSSSIKTSTLSSTLSTTSASTKNVEPVSITTVTSFAIKSKTTSASEPASIKKIFTTPIIKPDDFTTPSNQKPHITFTPITTLNPPRADEKFTPLSTTSKIINFLENNSARPAIRHPILDDVLTIYKAFMSTTTEDPISSEDLEGSGARSKSRIEEYAATSTPYFDTTVTKKSYVSSTTEFDIFDSKETNQDLSLNINKDESDLDYRELDIAGTGNISLKNNEENTIDQLDSQSSTTKRSLELLPSVDDHPIFRENFLENIDDFVGERYEKRSSMENLSENTKLTVTEPASKNLIYSICAASLTTFLILVIVVTLYAVRNSRKKVEKNRAKKDLATVAVFTTSIFHSPLPDPPPPTFDNPTYLATSDNGNCIHQKNDSIEIQEFSVVFQKPIKPPRLDKQYLYDHPPSTGSYRASSEVDTLSQYNSSQKSAVVLEPLYDEIPSKGPNRIGIDSNSNGNVDSLYMNTCGRTEF